MFLKVEFSTILLGIQIIFIDKKFNKFIKISWNRKYIKGDVVFWKLMDNISFQTIVFLSISSMFLSPIKFNFTKFDFFFFAFLLAFSYVFSFSFSPFFLCIFFFAFSIYLLLSFHTTFLQNFFNSCIFKNMIICFWHK